MITDSRLHVARARCPKPPSLRGMLLGGRGPFWAYVERAWAVCLFKLCYHRTPHVLPQWWESSLALVVASGLPLQAQTLQTKNMISKCFRIGGDMSAFDSDVFGCNISSIHRGIERLRCTTLKGDLTLSLHHDLQASGRTHIMESPKRNVKRVQRSV